MTKELTFNASESQIDGDASVSEIFGISEERAKELTCAFSETIRVARAAKRDGEGFAVNRVAAFAAFIADEKLNGNDVAYLCYSGFIAAEVAIDALVEGALASPATMIAMLRNRH